MHWIGTQVHYSIGEVKVKLGERVFQKESKASCNICAPGKCVTHRSSDEQYSSYINITCCYTNWIKNRCTLIYCCNGWTTRYGFTMGEFIVQSQHLAGRSPLENVPLKYHYWHLKLQVKVKLRLDTRDP